MCFAHKKREVKISLTSFSLMSIESEKSKYSVPHQVYNKNVTINN